MSSTEQIKIEGLYTKQYTPVCCFDGICYCVSKEDMTTVEMKKLNR